MTSVDYDDVVDNFSIFSRYYLVFMTFIFLAFAANGVYSNNYVFAVAETAYKCKDESFGNNTCYASDKDNNTRIYCTEWIYEDPNSFVAEFQLACQEWKRTLVGTVHSFGYMVGLLIIGPLSDRLGRKTTLVIAGMLGGVIGVAKSLVPWYWGYVVLEFLEAAIGDNSSPTFILAIEAVSSKKRVLFFILSSFGFTFGGFLLPAAAWMVPYWRTLLRVLYTPSLFFFLYLFFIDESPRWLLIKGKKEKAVKILQKAANMNKIDLDKAMVEKLTCEQEKNISFLQLLKITLSSRTLIQRCLICTVWWTTSTFVFFGLTINSVSLPGNKFVNYMLLSAVDLPGNFVTLYILTKFKRKRPLIVSFLMGAVLCLSQPFVPTSLTGLPTAFYMAGKLMSSFYFNITYVYTSELFPTYTRNSMHALCSSLGRVGSMVAPQTPLLMQYWVGLPAMVFGGASLVAGLVTFFVPDAGDNSLPNTVKQAEALGKEVSTCDKEDFELSKTGQSGTSQGEDNLAFSGTEETKPSTVVHREGKVCRL